MLLFHPRLSPPFFSSTCCALWFSCSSLTMPEKWHGAGAGFSFHLTTHKATNTKTTPVRRAKRGAVDNFQCTIPDPMDYGQHIDFAFLL